MSFGDRLQSSREEKALAERSRIESAELERAAKKAAAFKAARALLTEAHQAVEALRQDRERSRVELMTVPAMTNPISVFHRRHLGVEPMLAEVRYRESERLFARIATRTEFAGWWVCREPFEFCVPLEGKPTVGLLQTMNWLIGPKITFEAFAEGALYQYQVGSGPSSTREGTAAEGFRDFCDQVMRHLVDL